MAKPKVVFLPIPAVGHMMSMVEMAKLLLHHHPGRPDSHFSVTVLVPGYPYAAVEAYICSVADSHSDIQFQRLPHVDPPTHYEGPENYISIWMEMRKPQIKSALSDLLHSSAAPVAALIIDCLCTTAIDVTTDLGIPCYVYYPTSAAALALMLYLPILHDEFPMEFEEMKAELSIPGLCLIPPLLMPTALMRKTSGSYSWFVYHARRLLDADGILVNTFAELHPEALWAMEEGRCTPGHRTPQVFPVGPLVALEGGAEPQHECLAWLDGQPPRSVVFLCFGSRGCFEPEQVAEMAAGLERSGHRFLWSLRMASRELAQGMPKPADADLRAELPDWFLERTQGRGMVWPSWAPQVAVLAHPAVGGFVTHCGWNSCLESLRSGVPMLAWPLYAEQHFNALVMEEMGVALRLRVDRRRGNFVAAEELERGVRGLMGSGEEGRKVRAKAEEKMVLGRRAREEGGSSFGSMERLVKELLRMPAHDKLGDWNWTRSCEPCLRL